MRGQAFDYGFNAFASTVHACTQEMDVLHYFGCDQVPFTTLSRILRQRVLLSLDGLEWQREGYPWIFRAYLRSFAELAMVYPNQVTADSKRSQLWYLNRTGREAMLVPYGTAVPEDVELRVLDKHGLSPGRYILFIGRLVREKGAHTLVDAFKKVKGDVRLVIVGDTKNPGEYVAQLRKNADSRTQFLGFVHGGECNALRNEALIYVHPSLFDGTSISLLYALAAGKGVVSSDIEDNVEVAGEAAVYFRAEDSDDLAARLQQMIDNPGMVYELGEKAQERARKLFDWDRITDDYEGIYERMQGK